MKKIIFTLFLVAPVILFAQERVTITGTVISAVNNGPVVGATIMEKNTRNGAVTDNNGHYRIIINNGAVLTFSAVGFNSSEENTIGKNVVDVALTESSSNILNEVVVVGYGVIKKSDLTSSITSVKGDELKSNVTGNALYSLQGKANGVQITGGGGPGSVPRVIIRGVTTINGSDPLYVVDGVPMGTNINFLNQEDIESIEVLKDASAAAIYGTRGSNGVIMVTTRKGRKGKTQFQFSASGGVQTLHKPKMAGASVYEKVFKTRYTNDGNVPVWNGKNNVTDAAGTDWWDQTVNKFAYLQTYNIGFQGGNEKSIYSGSIGYFRQGSQYDIGSWERLTGRFNSEYTFSSKVKAGVDFVPRMESWQNTPNLFSDAMRMDPTTPVFRDSTLWSANPLNNYARSNNNQVWNPVASLARQNNRTTEYGLLMDPYLSFEPIKGLIAKTQFSVNGRFQIGRSFSPKFFIDNLEKNDNSLVSQSSNSWIDWNWTNTLNYLKTISLKHNLNLMAGYTMERFANYQLSGSRENVPSNYPDLQYINAGTLNPKSYGTNIYTALLSYLGRVMYNYDGRYYLTASLRVDGSSMFPKSNKYASFPSVSGAWRISRENFMKEQRLFSELKLRTGWGRVGNQNIDPNSYLNLIGASDYVFGSNAQRFVGTSISMVGNQLLKWETVEDYNLGLDMAFLKNRLIVTADVYQKESNGMLMKKNNLLVLGYPMWDGQMWTNIGSMSAKGWELSLNWADKARKVGYEIGINLSGVKNKARKFVADAPLWRGGFFNDYIIRNEAGGEISRFYGYVADGIFQNRTEVNSYTNEHGDLLQPNAQPGDIRFKDLDNDGVLDEKDKTFIGNAFPKLMLGQNTHLYYRNIDFIANFYGTFGNDVYNSAKAGLYAGTDGINVFADAYNKAWHGEGTSNLYPRLSVADKNMNFRRVSSFFVEDGSYFRCKLLQLGYTFPEALTKNLKVRLSAAAQNLFTITKYSGMDPERAAMGSVIESGIDNIGYPNPRTFLLGLNVNF